MNKSVLYSLGAIISVLCISVYIFLNPLDTVALSKLGSSGEEVIQIQKRLSVWGYYKGDIDGVYGSKTVEAVKLFQKNNGITVDGVAGPATLSKMGISSGSSADDANLYLLAKIINGEARGESYMGQVAVGAVVLNRVRHSSFPNTIAGVIYQPGAFTAVDDGQINAQMSESSYRAARDALNGWDPANGAIYYYNPKTATSKWIRTRPVITTIGSHVFCS